MIKEDYVSFETAKLLKEKGFDEYGMCFYTLKDEGREGYKSNRKIGEFAHNSHPDLKERAVSCPTLQMAMKWLREVHYLHITVHPGVSEYGFVWTYAIVFAKEAGKGETHFYKISQITTPIVKSKSYETACETAIKYSLENLI